jgi:hypothetical protein
MVLEPNRPVFEVQTRTAGGLPGPVANTTQGTGGGVDFKPGFIPKPAPNVELSPAWFDGL